MSSNKSYLHRLVGGKKGKRKLICWLSRMAVLLALGLFASIPLAWLSGREASFSLTILPLLVGGLLFLLAVSRLFWSSSKKRSRKTSARAPAPEE